MSKKYELDFGKGKIKVDFTSKPLTSYGGLSLLAAFFNKIEFREFIKKLLPLNEKSNNRIPIFSRILSFILTTIIGGTRFSHMLFIGDSLSIKEIFNVKRLPKAATTLTRLFGKFTTLKLANIISNKIWDYLIKILPWKKIKEDWMSFDSSVMVKYGKQEGARKGYNPKKPGRKSYNPIIAFLNYHRYVLNIWNRSGNCISSNNICNFFDEVYSRLQSKIKILGILGDSGFYQIKFINHLEEKHLNYIIKAVLYSTLKRKIISIPKSEWNEIDEGISITEFEFKPNNWDIQRRYVIVRQDAKIKDDAMGKSFPLFEDIDMNDYKYSAIVTNIKKEDMEAIEVWRKIRKRSNDENIIKEVKEDFGLEGFSMNSFYATEVGMQIRLLIYNIFQLFRTSIMDKKEKPQRLKTLRRKYFIIPGYIGSDGHDKILRLHVKTKKIKDKFIIYLKKILQFSIDLNLQNSIAMH